MKFSRLTYIGTSSKKYGKGSIASEFLCDCGTTIFVPLSLVEKGKIKSCGCLNKENARKIHIFASNKNKLPLGTASFNRLYRSYKNRATRKSQEFLLSENEFRLITSQNCHYCGKLPKQYYKSDRYYMPNGDYLHNGIDRKDSSKGYTLENSLPCCEICNKAKRDLSYDEFISWIDTLMVFRKTQDGTISS